MIPDLSENPSRCDEDAVVSQEESLVSCCYSKTRQKRSNHGRSRRPMKDSMKASLPFTNCEIFKGASSERFRTRAKLPQWSNLRELSSIFPQDQVERNEFLPSVTNLADCNL